MTIINALAVKPTQMSDAHHPDSICRRDGFELKPKGMTNNFNVIVPRRNGGR